MKDKFSIIIDVDTGIDDAVAIITACAQKQLDIKLITCCFGNADQSHVVKNTITVLENINRQDIPVCAGASVPLDNEAHKIRAHGINGLGGYSKQITTKPISSDCSKAMHDIVSKSELTYIVACGPYTNIANYIKEYPQDLNKFKLVAVTGTNINSKTNPYLNFNITIDIPSMKYVLEHVSGILFCTSDMGHKAYIPAEDFIKSADCSEVGRFLATIYPSHKDRTVKNGAALHDACGIAWLAKPKMFKLAYAKAEFKVAKNGKEYLDFDYSSSEPNCVVTIDIKNRAFHSWYYKSLKYFK